ncbi:LacI family DNA-binding transcriptional regulator [Furfurilactobacillus sp. WILCCON 0119]
MPKKTTITDIAEAAGISVTTVSQILNGKGDRFSAVTRQKVLGLQKKWAITIQITINHLRLKLRLE